MHFLFVIAYTCYTLFVVIMQCGTSRSCQVLIFALFTIFSSWRMTQIHQARWLIESLQIFSVTYGFLLKFQRSVKRPFKGKLSLFPMFILHILQLQKWPYIYSFDLKELYIMSKWTHSEVNFLILSLYREIFTLTDRTKAMFTLLSCGQLLTGLIQIVSIEIDQQICRRSRGRGK